ncbi:hypothetical protein PV328_002726 [Microctonus aethiopoides]|uniref:tRNA (uracil(54)-C(5))-methyltransferase n=1 Tax=Microctonus aethiopoides TaxID=144406 RepID=A0AA39F6W1_9HYME|nr:hypothetical protein PV328_002726 [Microctonus aethiopoides]
MDSEKNSLDEKMEEGEERNTNEEEISDEIPVIKLDDDIKQETIMSHEESQNNPIDFTADVSLDHLNDNDVLEGLNDIENSAADSENYAIESEDMTVDRSSLVKLSSQDDKKNIKLIDETQEIILVDEINKESQKSPEELWYEEKINSKVKTVVERLSKLARVLKHYYPCYKNCLERIEAKIGTPVCKLDTPRQCPTNLTQINRWKFICTRKAVTDSADSNTPTDNRNKKTVWRLEPCESSNTNINCAFEMIPAFVNRSVKMFEDFINNLEQTEQSAETKAEANDDDVVVLESDGKSSEDVETNENGTNSDCGPQWLWLLVRSNSKDELMMFITGKCITHITMESLKQLFETGLGKDCNVKSLYCKSLTKTNNVQTSNTTFLVGAEALDEKVGSLKIQLAPKTNFWLSTSGAEELTKTVESVLDPPELGTVIDIGCGLGLIGLSIARKCYQVIGIDSPSEVEEAEMTCELNKIKNAYFLMGEPTEMMNTINKSVEWRRVFAIINANTAIGRTPEVMTGLRKIKNLRRIVMVTTLTKQSVRSILELTRPADDVLGDPFVATRAVVVDTLPSGPQFEVVILMERRPLPQVLNAVLSQVSPDLVTQNSPKKGGKNSPKKNNAQKPANKKSNFMRNVMAAGNRKGGGATNRKNPMPGVKPVNNRGKQNEKPNDIPKKKLVKNPFYDKPFAPKNTKNLNHKKMSGGSRPQMNLNQHKAQNVSKSPRKNSADSSLHMRKGMVNASSYGSSANLQKRKYEWDLQSRSGSNSFIPDKKSRENDDNLGLRMPGDRGLESDLLQKVQEQQRLLEVAKQKLTSSSQVVDNYTAKEVQDMLNLAIERTNQIQNQIPRSVWDRIAPPEHQSPEIIVQDEIMFKGRRIQEISHEDISITTSNQGYRQTFDASWAFNKHSSIPPLEPNLIAPLDKYTVIKPNIQDHKPSHFDNTRKSESRWVPPSCTRRSTTPSTKPIVDPTKLMLSAPRGNFSSYQHQQSVNLQDISALHQAPSTSRQFMSSRQLISAPLPELMHGRKSPPRQQSPLKRPLIPVGYGDDWDIPSRGASEQQTGWRAIDNRPLNNTNNRRDFNAQDNFRPVNNLNPNWDGKNSSDNRANNGSVNGWNQKQLVVRQQGNNSWQQQQQQQQQKQPISSDIRFSGASGGEWNIRGKDSINTIGNIRNENRRDLINQRWNEPQQNKNSWNQKRDFDDNNDLPEDARDPWCDDNNLPGPLKGNWNKTLESNSWSMPKDNRQNLNPLMMNTNPQWQANMNNSNQNFNNARWSGRPVGNDNMMKPPQNMNWQQRNNNNNNNKSNNNGWRQQNSFGGFQQSRPYN